MGEKAILAHLGGIDLEISKGGLALIVLMVLVIILKKKIIPKTGCKQLKCES